jgi:hypothetical protein
MDRDAQDSEDAPAGVCPRQNQLRGRQNDSSPAVDGRRSPSTIPAATRDALLRVPEIVKIERSNYAR